MGEAIFGYDLIKEGDRVLIALSGGEDSLVLLHFLSQWRYYYHKKIKLFAIHLDLSFPKNEEEYLEKVKRLKVFCEEREADFIFDKITVGKLVIEAHEKGKTSPCFICSWNRRKYLFKLAQSLNIQKISFGHHKDDVITTFFMNLFYNGELSTILPKQEMFRGELYLIRPLYFVEKEIISRFVAKEKWQVLENPCPFSGKTKRNFWYDFLKKQIFALNPILKKNAFSAIFNPRLEYLPKPPKKGK